MAEERLQKVLARAGISSRRAAEQLIAAGRVHVNGKPVRELGTRADPERDRIVVDGRAITRERHVYYLLHKPRGMVTTLHDPEGRPSLGELLKDVTERVYPVGRLDFHTSGALLLTNDGDLAQALLHPSHAVPKTYVAKVSREVDESMMRALESGVTLDDGYKTRGARLMHLRDEEGKSWIEITITEGKNRQIHRMFEALGARVMRLSRISFAGLSTEAMRPEDLRPLARDEVDSLRRQYLPRELLERSAERGEHARKPRDAQEGAEAPQQRKAAKAERGRHQERSSPAHGQAQPRANADARRGRGGAERAEPSQRRRDQSDERAPQREGERSSGRKQQGTKPKQRTAEANTRGSDRRRGEASPKAAKHTEGRAGRSAGREQAREQNSSTRTAAHDGAQRSTRRQNEKSPAKVDSPRRAGHKSRPT